MFLPAICLAKDQAWIGKWASVVFEENNFIILMAGTWCFFAFFFSFLDFSNKKHNEVIVAVPRIITVLTTSPSPFYYNFFLDLCSD